MCMYGHTLTSGGWRLKLTVDAGVADRDLLCFDCMFLYAACIAELMAAHTWMGSMNKE